MTTEYLVVEVCEQFFNGIDEKTFRRNKKKKYVPDLEARGFKVTEGKRGRFSTIILDDSERKFTPQQIEDAEFLEIIECDIGKHDITLLKFILKSILERKIVPGHNELAHHANLVGIKTGQTTITNYMAFFRENNIIVDPMTIPVWDNNPLIKRVVDEETGEILPTYHKRICNRIYFDFAKDGSSFERDRLSKNTQEAIEMAYYNMLPEMMETKIYPLYTMGHSDKYINNERMKAQSQLLREIGTAYGINYCVRMDEPIINPIIKRQLKEYFGIGV
ncbi:hypothetical protein P9443_19110 [Peribacillus frigoritolerans]|uniref:hypothetical protein n=1 Tax=Peribacillus frigoritolerans TaxID=450367 RepID=UPI002E2379B8|nr:hypothetical protein [Peribacillus frigoritolerans]